MCKKQTIVLPHPFVLSIVGPTCSMIFDLNTTLFYIILQNNIHLSVRSGSDSKNTASVYHLDKLCEDQKTKCYFYRHEKFENF